ncbi:MAG: cell division protein FtsQ [Mediterranea sp.]|jgi:cell division protein FtsQ|nr:cell division protein FtsQ [Mediterranea sp.]
MKWLRRIFIVLILLVITAYLGISVTAFNRKDVDTACSDIRLVIKDSVNAGFITKREVTDLLSRKGVNPIGKLMQSINTEKLEKELAVNPLIDRVECYKTLSNKVCVEVYQRIPVLRILPSAGEGYYIDNKGTVMPSDTKCAAHISVVTGRVDKAFATNELYRFALFLQRNAFWNAQIAQIHVLSGRNIELIPRVGNHILHLGQLADYENKLERTRRFYEQALNRVGWNKYSRINVEFSNQIICTKREPLN